jgi:hypothetical protein
LRPFPKFARNCEISPGRASHGPSRFGKRGGPSFPTVGIAAAVEAVPMSATIEAFMLNLVINLYEGARSLQRSEPQLAIKERVYWSGMRMSGVEPRSREEKIDTFISSDLQRISTWSYSS